MMHSTIERYVHFHFETTNGIIFSRITKWLCCIICNITAVILAGHTSPACTGWCYKRTKTHHYVVPLISCAIAIRQQDGCRWNGGHAQGEVRGWSHLASLFLGVCLHHVLTANGGCSSEVVPYKVISYILRSCSNRIISRHIQCVYAWSIHLDFVARFFVLLFYLPLHVKLYGKFNHIHQDISIVHSLWMYRCHWWEHREYGQTWPLINSNARLGMQRVSHINLTAVNRHVVSKSHYCVGFDMVHVYWLSDLTSMVLDKHCPVEVFAYIHFCIEPTNMVYISIT